MMGRGKLWKLLTCTIGWRFLSAVTRLSVRDAGSYRPLPDWELLKEERSEVDRNARLLVTLQIYSLAIL